MKRSFSFAIPCLTLLVSCSGEPATSRQDLPPNVLFLTVDTLRADHMGCYGYPRNTTPFLDSLAQNSTLFEYGLVQWPKTGPSMASLFTSTYGSTSGVKQKTGRIKIPETFDTFAERLQESDYETLAVVSNSSLNRLLGYDHGFDEFVEHFFIETGSARQVASQAKKLLNGRDRDRPFFLWSHFIDPHTPYEAPDQYRSLFRGDDLYQRSEGPAIPLYVPDVSKGPSAIGQVPPVAQRDNCEQVRDYVVEYDAEIRYFDDEMKQFFAWMEDNGHLDRTIVVFTSDHGESLGDHDYYFEHGRFPYDACTRVPLFIHHPNHAPATIPEPVALLDVVPTVLDFLDLPPGFQTEGKSLRDWIEQGNCPEEPRDVITESGYRDDFTVALRRGPWKIICISNEDLRRELQGTRYELYHVLDDPLETNNLAERNSEVFERLKKALDQEVAGRHGKVGLAQQIEGGLPDDLEEVLQALGYVDGD